MGFIISSLGRLADPLWLLRNARHVLVADLVATRAWAPGGELIEELAGEGLASGGVDGVVEGRAGAGLEEVFQHVLRPNVSDPSRWA